MGRKKGEGVYLSDNIYVSSNEYDAIQDKKKKARKSAKKISFNKIASQYEGRSKEDLSKLLTNTKFMVIDEITKAKISRVTVNRLLKCIYVIETLLMDK